MFFNVGPHYSDCFYFFCLHDCSILTSTLYYWWLLKTNIHFHSSFTFSLSRICENSILFCKDREFLKKLPSPKVDLAEPRLKLRTSRSLCARVTSRPWRTPWLVTKFGLPENSRFGTLDLALRPRTLYIKNCLFIHFINYFLFIS